MSAANERNESAGGSEVRDVFCPSCGKVFPSDRPFCPGCRRCPACGAEVFEDPSDCPACGHPTDPAQLTRVQTTLDPTAVGNQRLYRKVRIQQHNRELMSRISILKMLGCLLVPFLLLQIVAIGVAAVTPIHYQWMAGLSFIIVVPGGIRLALFQLRNDRWQWLLKTADDAAPDR